MTHHRWVWNSLLLALMLGVLAGLWAVGVAAQGAGVLEGQIINRSGEVEQPVSAPVTLFVFKDMALQASTEITATASGEFRFDGLDASAGLVYQVAAEFHGLSYMTDFLTFENGTIPPITLEVYEPVMEPTDITVERLHLIVEVQPRSLRIGQLYVFSNAGKRTYTGDPEHGGDTLQFTLPEGAMNLEFQEGQLGDRFVETPGGFTDTSPVVPGVGTQQVLYSYDLDFDSPDFEFVVTSHYTVTGMNVLVSDPLVKASSSVLQPEGIRNMQGQDWLGLVGEGFGPGQPITLTFGNLPLEMRQSPVASQGAASGVGRTGTATLVVLGLILFGLGVLVGYRLPRGGESSSSPRTAAQPEAPAGGEDDLIVALADLDDAYERGELPVNEYRSQRDELKRQLTERFADGDD